MKQFKAYDNVPGMRECKKVKNAKAIQINEDFEVYSTEGIVTGKPGDYLMKGIEGECYVCDKQIFEDSYEFVNQNKLLVILRYLILAIGFMCIIILGLYDILFLGRVFLSLLGIKFNDYVEPEILSKAVQFATTYLAICFMVIDWRKLIKGE